MGERGKAEPINVKAKLPLDQHILRRRYVPRFFDMARGSLKSRNVYTNRAASYVARSASRRRTQFKGQRAMRDLGLMPSAVTQAAKLASIRLMNKAEQKFLLFGDQNYQIWHNGSRYTGGGSYLLDNNMLRTTQGVTQNTRSGDSIYSQKIHVRLWLSNKADRPNVMYRVVVIAGENTDMPTGDLPTPVALSGEFFSVSGGGNVITNVMNRDKFKIIRDFVVQPFAGDFSLETSANNKEHSRLVEFDIPINKRIKYKTDNGTVPEGANCYGMVVYAYDAFGSALTDNIASCAFSAQHFFKDI